MGIHIMLVHGRQILFFVHKPLGCCPYIGCDVLQDFLFELNTFLFWYFRRTQTDVSMESRLTPPEPQCVRPWSLRRLIFLFLLVQDVHPRLGICLRLSKETIGAWVLMFIAITE